MDRAELERLYLEMESDRTERKESLGDGDAIRKAICALANDLPGHCQPGVIFVGVTDRGECRNLTISDELLKRLAAMAQEASILPPPDIAVQAHVLAGCEVAVVQVRPASAPPVRWHGRTWVRVGPTTVAASPQQESTLSERRRGRDLPFDVQPLPSAALSDLDLDFFPALRPSMDEDERPIERQLEALRLASGGPAGWAPTVLGVLGLGRVPRAFVPGAYIQFLRLDGATLTDPKRNEKEISGPLAECLAQIEELLKIQITTAVDFTSADREIRLPDYPLVALQQLVRNAVMHRSYDASNAPIRIYWFEDRIEIQNPGGPFGQVTADNFGQGLTDYRNPNLAAVLKDLGYVQRFGAGIATARAELAKNGNPPPAFEVQQSHVLVIVRRRP